MACFTPTSRTASQQASPVAKGINRRDCGRRVFAWIIQPHTPPTGACQCLVKRPLDWLIASASITVPLATERTGLNHFPNQATGMLHCPRQQGWLSITEPTKAPYRATACVLTGYFGQSIFPRLHLGKRSKTISGVGQFSIITRLRTIKRRHLKNHKLRWLSKIQRNNEEDKNFYDTISGQCPSPP